ncbi:MAG: transketolase [Pseudomonadales bacterium]|nr:transketolase [Pseudomonadales bacterium]
MSDKNIYEIKQFAWRQRRRILEMALNAGADSSHFGGGLSFVDIAATLFGSVMNYNSEDPQDPSRDRFILSKGHGVLGYYSALAEIGYLTDEELSTFEKDGSFLLGHPVIKREKGIEFSTGSLGMGLALGIGVSIAAKRRQRDFKVYVVMGDGECNEGSVWEAALAAPNMELDNLTCIVDRNKFQQTGSNEEIMALNDVASKFKSFDWDVHELDGHDVEALYQALSSKREAGKPRAIIAHTIKGKGFSFSENDNAWHHKILTNKLYDQGLQELETQRTELESSWN